MKKLAFISTLLLTTTNFAATTGTLLLKGNVPAALSIQVNANTGVNDALDLATSQTDLTVATVTEASNSNTGYKIAIQSQNAGQLKNGNLDTFTYTLKYDGQSVDLSSGNAVEAKNAASAAIVNTTSDVQISYTGKPAEQMVQGDYTDTLTFTISAN